ncbi:PaaI family thioesterase [Kumtagia ephedrae]|uniref:PaaI family thioesterase n=1 Tax=Kumtagia ephedrae TaxID=2116701 RepID=UPI0014040B77|nr:PaaI family thioesterase [Mesorhizobium ephedrae]
MITETVADFGTDRPPAGFRPLLGRAEVEMVAGPFYERRTAGGQWQLGFRVTPRKLNRMGVCHGGVLAVFADIQGSALKKSLDLVAESPTVTLGIDYAAPAHAGAWVQSRPELVRQTATLLFFHALFYADDTLCARASGIYYLSSRRLDV